MPNLETEDGQLEAIAKLEEHLGLKKGFFADLKNEDDWSFVVKTHALIESSVTALITTRLNNPALDSHIFSLDFSGSRHSKLILAATLGLIDNDVQKFITGLAKIRNRFVHAVKYTTLTLSQYANALQREEQGDFLHSIAVLYLEHSDPHRFWKAFNEHTMQDPKARLWDAALHVITLLSYALVTVQAEVETDKLKRELMKKELAYLKKLSGQLSPRELMGQ